MEMSLPGGAAAAAAGAAAAAAETCRRGSGALAGRTQWSAQPPRWNNGRRRRPAQRLRRSWPLRGLAAATAPAASTGRPRVRLMPAHYTRASPGLKVITGKSFASTLGALSELQLRNNSWTAASGARSLPSTERAGEVKEGLEKGAEIKAHLARPAAGRKMPCR
ncbi:uncharacterized protein LOC126481771 [Schistocerca serialis cubense]|uniref:uncharacterized protein LOC126481771 n=1 Tax=Schistocerca serialis cubense TaxID=2023355 RepID=UPI00214E475D|nr:uncharacterized protein LOC126481771 [Schistocerca serialis cubense]